MAGLDTASPVYPSSETVGGPNFANRTIWTGDNLDILRGLNSESVDLIYLDPPFNSNRDYAAPVGSQAAGAAFKDTWTLSDLDVAWTGYIADEHPAVAYLLSSAGMAHSKGMQSYLTMMAVRLLELHRVLKPTGSLYLHCDPTASHYLKMLLDAIFGRGQFRNEVIWRRTGSHNYSNRFGPIHDVLLFYARTDAYQHRSVFTPYMRGHVDTFFKRQDDIGRYWTNSIHGSGTRNGSSGALWRGFDPTAEGRHWAVPRDLVTAFGIDPDLPQHEKLDALYELGLIDLPTNGGLPTYRQYLDQSPGQLLQDIWAFQPHTKDTLHDCDAAIDEDVRWIPPRDKKERTGYPTQKPLGLLSRVIRSSSDPGDIVLDPFAGCATACVAAEALDRQWIGIDLSQKAVELVNERLRAAMGDLFHYGFVTARDDIPQRTDLDAPKDYRTHKHVLYGEQEGQCNGCRTHFEFRHFTIDHIIPVSKGGTDHKRNLQLLCGHCNSVKGDRPMEYLLAQLQAVPA